jgi:ferredoxin
MSPFLILSAVAAAIASGATLAALNTASRIREAANKNDGEQKKRRTERQKAVVACAGPESSRRLFNYAGLPDCRLAHLSYSGDRACEDSCLGYGTCRAVCPIGAIELSPEGIPTVGEDCDGCGICARECPTGAMKLISRDADVYVRCSSRAEASERESFCLDGCNACGVCANAVGAGFSIKSGLAAVDYRVRGDRRPAILACPRACIIPFYPSSSEKKAFQAADNRIEWTDRSKGTAERG